MSLPQAGVNSTVEGWLFTDDGPVWVTGTVVQGQSNIILNSLGTPVATVGSLCQVSGASPIVQTGSGTVYHNNIPASTEWDIVTAGNFYGWISQANQSQVLTRR